MFKKDQQNCADEHRNVMKGGSVWTQAGSKWGAMGVFHMVCTKK